MDRPIRYERRSLYEKVWKDPLIIVSKEYGISDVALKKVCRALNVPTPGRGYWAKLRVGRADPPPALPEHSGPTTVHSRPERHRRRRPTDRGIKETLLSIEAEEFRADRQIKVDPDGNLTSALAVKLQARLNDIDETRGRSRSRLEKGDGWAPPPWRRLRGGLIEPGDGYLSVITTQSLRMRALLCADAFICAMRERGFEVRVDGGKTIFQQGPFAMHFRLSEMTKAHAKSRGSIEQMGLLRLTLRASVAGQTPTSICLYDRSHASLESQLNVAAANLRRAAAVWINRLDTNEATTRQAKREAFYAEAERWAVVQRHRAYLTAVELEARRRVLEPWVRETLEAWLQWAHRVCDEDDPLPAHLK